MCQTGSRPLTLAYSTDADDAFQFWALRTGRLDPSPLVFQHHRADTQTLNEAALRGEHDVCAVSIAVVPRLLDRYRLLPHGGSVGRGYGPVLVAPEPRSLASLENRPIAIPGADTTAALVLRMAAPPFRPCPVPISPFEAVFQALDSGAVEAAVLIHEGRLTYRERGLHLVLDLGQWWQEQSGRPLPLGGNVIRASLGEEGMRQVSSVLRESIAWGMEHRDEVLAALHREEARLDRKRLDHYLDLYANQDTLDYGEEGRQAVEALLAQAAGRPLSPQDIWSP